MSGDRSTDTAPARPTVAEVLELLRELEAAKDPNASADQRREFQARKEELLARIRNVTR